MTYTASKFIRDLVAATWARTETAVMALADAFGLPCHIPDRLPHPVCKELAEKLTVLEALVRRMLLVIAMQLPPPQLPRSLPPVRAYGSATGSNNATGLQPMLPGERLPPLPALPKFQIIEPVERETGAISIPSGVTMLSGDPAPSAARPERPDDAPAARLIRRLQALAHVFANEPAYVMEMKYIIAEARGRITAPLPLNGNAPPVLKNLHMAIEDHDALRHLHTEAARLNLELDTT